MASIFGTSRERLLSCLDDISQSIPSRFHGRLDRFQDLNTSFPSHFAARPHQLNTVHHLMASQASSTFNFPTLKRLACDRCRKQKLRCPSRASDAQPCSRCIRAGVECITGYTRPLGRSHRISYGSASRNNLGQSNVSPTPSPQQLHLSTTLQDALASPSATKYPDTSLKQTLPDPLIGTASSPTWFFTGVEEEGDSLGYDNALDNLADTHHISPKHHITIMDNNPEFSWLSPQYIETSEGTCSLASSSLASTTGDSTPSAFSTKDVFSKTLSRVVCDLRLSQLNVDLCQQAQRNMAADQQSGRTQVGADRELAEAETGPRYMSGHPDTTGQSKEFGDALCSTSEFMTIMESKLDDIAPKDPSTLHEAHWPLANLTCVLNLISCYLLIVAVFDRLVFRLYEQMICDGNDSPSPDSSKTPHSAGPQTFPGLRLASFHVQQSNLQTKILIQIIEHQFQMIERSLGLPVELRVSSDRREPYEEGLLQSGLDEGLLQAVITRHCPMTGPLASLRENIMKMRRLLAT